ncbi:hypothetical protein BdWA1_003297 [Babesia duncani]|uniref:Uncharacterized protein n=1 Tax=Babesia duncani TaxID=323732 RepID=A0AAD9PJ18_9APIC|nr:hypothetical protein BdWA1_003297 [Babesia duncani]
MDDSLVSRKLKDTRDMLKTQLDQMDAAAPSLEKTSGYIEQQQLVLRGMYNVIFKIPRNGTSFFIGEGAFTQCKEENLVQVWTCPHLFWFFHFYMQLYYSASISRI